MIKQDAYRFWFWSQLYLPPLSWCPDPVSPSLSSLIFKTKGAGIHVLELVLGSLVPAPWMELFEYSLLALLMCRLVIAALSEVVKGKKLEQKQQPDCR